MITLTDLLEPEANEFFQGTTTVSEVSMLSCAISLKRIADRLSPDGIRDLANTPVNAFGEGFAESIQQAFIRGQRGDTRW